MNELVWGIKNGELDQVRDIVENKVVDLHTRRMSEHTKSRTSPGQSVSPLIPLYVPMPGNPEESDLERAAQTVLGVWGYQGLAR